MLPQRSKLIAIYASSIALFFMLHFVTEPTKTELNPRLFESEFNATKAYEYAYTLATTFPYRPTGSTDNARAAAWIQSELNKMGYKTTVQEFEVMLEGWKTGRNIYAVLERDSQESIAILANYDMVPMSFQAASDTAGHVGVLLELARIMRDVKTDRNIVFAFVDSEEWGMQGAKHFIEKYRGPEIRTVVVAEDLTVGLVASIYLESMGQFSGYSPLWLRTLCRDVGKLLNIPVIDPVGFEEYILRAVDISFTDQGPILAKRVPAIEISTRGDSPELARRVYHTPEDKMENMKVDSFKIYGLYLYTLVRNLDSAAQIPPYSDSYLMVSDDGYLPSYLTFITPSTLLIPIIYHMTTIREKRRDILYDLIEGGVYLAGFVASFLLIGMAPLLGLIPRYDTYPPPPRHPYLYAPNPLLYLLFITPPTITIFLSRRKRYGGALSPLFLITLTAFLSMTYNRYGTIVFLSQILFLWPWVPIVRVRVFRIVLILAGLSIFIMLLIQFGETIYLGPLITWYLLLGIAYGQFQLFGNMLTSIAAAAMIYMIKHFIARRG